ncbi:MAG: hypothetical protein RLZZ357_1656 [Bacteroidota bacterium]
MRLLSLLFTLITSSMLFSQGTPVLTYIDHPNTTGGRVALNTIQVLDCQTCNGGGNFWSNTWNARYFDNLMRMTNENSAGSALVFTASLTDATFTTMKTAMEARGWTITGSTTPASYSTVASLAAYNLVIIGCEGGASCATSYRTSLQNASFNTALQSFVLNNNGDLIITGWALSAGSYANGNFLTTLQTISPLTAFTYSYNNNVNSFAPWQYSTPLGSNQVFTTPNAVSWVGAESTWGCNFAISPTTYTLRSGASIIAQAAGYSSTPASPPAAPTIDTHPSFTSNSICAGSNSGTLTISATGATSYQWQISSNSGSTWTDITGMTGTTFPGMTMNSAGTYQFRCAAANTGGTTNSNVATLTVNALPSAPTTSNVTLCQGSTASPLTATGTAGNTLYWSSIAINQTTSNSGQTLSSGIYTIGQSFTATSAMTITGITYNFEQVYTPGAQLTLKLYSGQGLSGTVLSTVNVNGNITAGEFTFTFPTPIILTQNQVYTFNLSTTDSNPLSVRWNYNNGDPYTGGYYWRYGSAFTTDDIYFKVLTATTTTAPTPNTSVAGVNSYLVYQTNPTTGCSSSNSTLNVTVQATSLSGSTISSTTSIVYCLNAQATALTVNAPNATSFQWYAMDASNWAGQQAISGATTNTYTPPTNVAGTKYYRCYLASCSGSNTSSPVSGAITVTDGSVWTGTISSDPTNAGNWNSTCGSGNKIINAGTTYSPQFTNLTITNGESFTIMEGAQVTVTGVLTNGGILNINTGATLVQGNTSTYTGTGAVNVGQRITGGSSSSTPNGRFWYLGSPVTNANATSFYSTASSNVVRERNEPGNSWDVVANNSSTALTPGKGYYVRASNGSASSLTQTELALNFTGGGLNNYPTSSSLTIPCTRTTGVNFEGFNLVSNPYPSYLNWDLVTKNNVGNTMWYRTSTGSFWSSTMVFETYVAGAAGGIGTNLSGNVATKLIPPMQAFWVRVNSGNTTGSIVLDNSMRAHFTSFSGSTAGLRSTNDELKVFLRMNLLQEDKKDQLIVYMNGAATNGFDILDGEKMMQATLPQFYTKAGDKKIVINGLNSAKKQHSLPITLELPITGVHTFEIENLELETGLVWLEDVQEGTMEAITEGYTYLFYGEAGINADRFVLHFNILDNSAPSAPNYGEVNSSANFSGKGASVYAETAGVVVIKLPASTEGVTDIQIRDAAGRLVYTGSTNTLETSVQLVQANGIYYVTLNSNAGVEVRKVFIQQ